MRISENLPSTRLGERGPEKGPGLATPAPGERRLGGQPEKSSKWYYRSLGALLPTSPLPLTALQPVLGVPIARVGTFAAIDQVPEATLTVDNVIAPTTVLLIVFVTTAYLVGAPIAKHHVVAPQRVDVVSKLGAYNLLASLGAGYVFGQGSPAEHDQHRSHQS